MYCPCVKSEVSMSATMDDDDVSYFETLQKKKLQPQSSIPTVSNFACNGVKCVEVAVTPSYSPTIDHTSFIFSFGIVFPSTNSNTLRFNSGFHGIFGIVN